jgi:hypothetical protein
MCVVCSVVSRVVVGRRERSCENLSSCSIVRLYFFGVMGAPNSVIVRGHAVGGPQALKRPEVVGMSLSLVLEQNLTSHR